MTYFDEIQEIFSPKADNASRTKLKQIYYEHIKRRPAIIEKMKPLWDSARESWLTTANIDPMDIRNRTPSGFYPKISKEERTIIDTPLDELMGDFITSLTT